MFTRIIEDAARLSFGQWVYVILLVGGYFTILIAAIIGERENKKP
jgi:hypothetical protein